MICGRAYYRTPDNAEKIKAKTNKEVPVRARGNSRKSASKAEGGEERFKMTKAAPRSFAIYLQYRWNQLYRIRATRSVGNKKLRVMASEIDKQSSRFHDRVAAAAYITLCVGFRQKMHGGARTQRTPVQHTSIR